MSEKEELIDVDAAWARFEQKAIGVEPADVWTRNEAAAAHLQADEDRHVILEGQPQANRRRSLRFRPWMAAGIAAVLLIGLFTTDVGDKALAAMLRTFRVQHISGVEIGQNDYEKLLAALEQGGVSAGELSLDKFGTLTHSGGGKPQELSLKEAKAAFGGAFKALPGAKAEQTSARLEPQLQVTFKLHVDEVNRLLKRLGGKTMFPSGADEQPIVATLPSSLQVSERSDNGKGSSRSLVQMKQPTLDVPAGVDVEQVRKAVLELPFLPDSVRSKLENATDWKQTLFVPTRGGKMTTTSIGGREVIVTDGDSRYSAIWLDGSYLYYLSGDGGAYASEEALLDDVKEIIGS